MACSGIADPTQSATTYGTLGFYRSARATDAGNTFCTV